MEASTHDPVTLCRVPLRFDSLHARQEIPVPPNPDRDTRVSRTVTGQCEKQPSTSSTITMVVWIDSAQERSADSSKCKRGKRIVAQKGRQHLLPSASSSMRTATGDPVRRGTPLGAWHHVVVSDSGPRPRQASIDDGDRDGATRLLQDGFAKGHISYEEMDTRLHQVLTARTRSELDSALGSLAPEDDPKPTIATAAGRVRRKGAWRVPRTLKVESSYGPVHLDLSRAVIDDPLVDIELHQSTGRAKITLPRDSVVDVENLRTDGKAPIMKTGR
jgi:Domain of unknown function (DUF1707)